MEYFDIIDTNDLNLDVDKYMYKLSECFNTNDIEIFSKFKNYDEKHCVHIKIHGDVNFAIKQMKENDFCKDFEFFSDFILK